MADRPARPKDSSAEPKRLRLFIAINLPSRVQTALGAIQREATNLSEAVRWTRPGQLHLTLKFLGPIDPLLVPELETALTAAVKSVSTITLRAEGIGCFPNPNRPRVLWAGITGDLERLLGLHSRIENALSRWVEPEKRMYAAHITLARIQQLPSIGRSALKSLLDRHTGRYFGDWRATTVDLMQSLLSSTGSTYKCLGSIQLADHGVHAASSA